MNWTREELESVNYARLYDESVIKIKKVSYKPIDNNIWVVYFINKFGHSEVINSQNINELLTKEKFPEYYL